MSDHDKCNQGVETATGPDRPTARLRRMVDQGLAELSFAQSDMEFLLPDPSCPIDHSFGRPRCALCKAEATRTIGNLAVCPDHSSYLIGRFRASWYQSVARTADRLSESQARVAELLDRLGSQDREREEAYRPEAAPSFDVDPRVVDAIARVNDRVDHLASDLYAPERGLKDRVDALEQSRESIKRGLQAISNRVFPPTAPRGEEG